MVEESEKTEINSVRNECFANEERREFTSSFGNASFDCGFWRSHANQNYLDRLQKLLQRLYRCPLLQNRPPHFHPANESHPFVAHSAIWIEDWMKFIHFRRRIAANLTWCTNTSCDPSSGVMKPQPLVTLNHLHFPRLKSLGDVSSASSKKSISIKRHIFLSFFFCFVTYEWN